MVGPAEGGFQRHPNNAVLGRILMIHRTAAEPFDALNLLAEALAVNLD
jgi:hypothetical protein